jgi:hypothetical protein
MSCNRLKFKDNSQVHLPVRRRNYIDEVNFFVELFLFSDQDRGQGRACHSLGDSKQGSVNQKKGLPNRPKEALTCSTLTGWRDRSVAPSVY